MTCGFPLRLSAAAELCRLVWHYAVEGDAESALSFQAGVSGVAALTTIEDESHLQLALGSGICLVVFQPCQPHLPTLLW
jgi:hypothetical protein